MSMLLLATLLPGTVVILTTARMLWIRRQVRHVRVFLIYVYGCPDDEQTRRLLRLEALYRAPLLGRIVRLDNVHSCRF